MTALLPTGAFTPAGAFAMIELEESVVRTNAQAKTTTQLFIDVTITEDHKFESEVTDFPVESGGNVSDNIRQRPISVSIEGIVSNTPLDAIKRVRNQSTVRPATPPVFGPDLPPTLGPDLPPQTPAQEALAFLLKVWTSEETVTLRTSLGTFRKMALESLDVPRSKDVGDALRFSARFKQITLVDNARVVAGGGASGKRVGNRTGKPKTDKGTQPAEKPPWLIADSVRWNKGGVILDRVYYYGGKDLIVEVENVHWRTYSPTRFNHNAIGFGGVVERDLTEIQADAAANRDGYWSHSDGTPLTPEEVGRLRLDLARDRKNRGNGVPLPNIDKHVRKEKQVQDLNKAIAKDLHRPPTATDRGSTNDALNAFNAF